MGSFYKEHKNLVLVSLIGITIVGNIIIGSNTWFKNIRGPILNDVTSEIGSFIGLNAQSLANLPNIPSSIETTVLKDANFLTLQRLPALETIYPSSVIIDDDPLASFGEVKVNNSGIGNSIIITWDDPVANNIDSIRLYKSTTFGEIGTVIVELPQELRSYKDDQVEKDKTYFYTLRGVDTDGVEAEQMYQYPGRAIDIVPPTSHTNVRVVALGDETVHITWDDPSVDDYDFSRVYRSTLPGQLGKLLADSVRVAEVTDTTVIPGVVYYYTVTAVDTALNESPRDTSPSLAKEVIENTGILAKGDILLLLTNIRVEDLDTGNAITISWNNPSDSSFDHVRLYRSQKFNTLGNPLLDAPSKSTFYQDESVVRNTVYYYTLRTVDKEGRESDNTIQYVAVARDSIGPAIPSEINVKQSIPNRVEITWKRPQDSDFAYYRVYRSTNRNSAGPLIADKVTEEKWTDADIQDNRIYYYSVTSVDTSENESSKPISTGVHGGRIPFIPITLQSL